VTLTTREKRQFVIVVLLFAAAALLPFYGSGYWLSLGVASDY